MCFKLQSRCKSISIHGLLASICYIKLHYFLKIASLYQTVWSPQTACAANSTEGCKAGSQKSLHSVAVMLQCVCVFCLHLNPKCPPFFFFFFPLLRESQFSLPAFMSCNSIFSSDRFYLKCGSISPDQNTQHSCFPPQIGGRMASRRFDHCFDTVADHPQACPLLEKPMKVGRPKNAHLKLTRRREVTREQTLERVRRACGNNLESKVQ